MQVAWSVARTTSFYSPVGSNIQLQYTLILVDEGGVWNPSSHKAVIPRGGFYFIHVGGGVHSGAHTYLNFKVNNRRQFTTTHSSTNHNGTDTIARSGILPLSTGDQLTVKTNGPCYSDNMMQTIFIGFLL